jgi:Tol biopolymer transport system component
MRIPAWTHLKILTTALLLLALAVPPASAQYFGRNKVNYDDFDFRVLETEHFRIHYYPEAEEAVRDAARMAERWYDRHARFFLHRFDEKKPIIFYANDADFQQTNVINQPIGAGVGGFTESLRERVVMPLTGSYGATDHVLGHELVHSFQYDLALNTDAGVDLRRLPLWLVEGMAEYLTIGRHDAHTAMWMRDAALRDALPTIDALKNPREYFPYRYGQSLLAYLGGTYGDRSIANLYTLSGRIGVDSALVALYGQSPDALSAEWAEAVRAAALPAADGRTPADSAGRRVLARDRDAGRINVAPVLSPDGRYVAFLSERDLFDISLFVADAETGEVIASLGSVATEPDLDAIRFISSAGSWDPAGRRLVFVGFSDGDNELSIWDVDRGGIEETFRVRGVAAMTNPAWSPDGTEIAFSGTDGGVSDLYVLNLETREVRQLTNDRYADLQPTWSPDGETIAFTTDRRSTDLGRLRASQTMQLAFVPAAGGAVQVAEPFAGSHHHNPQYSPDGRSLYFIGDPDGFKDIYRTELAAADAGATGPVHRVTRLQTGVTGITALSPAMSVARQSGDLMFSVYTGGEYVGVALERERARGTPVRAVAGEVATGAAAGTTAAADTGAVPAAAILPPQSALGTGLVETALADARTGLPAGTDFEDRAYSSRLTLEGIVPPSVGVSVGGPFGSGVAGGVGLRFGDMLGNQRLDATLLANGTLRDIGGGVGYVNRSSRFNYGVSGSHVPLVVGRSVLQSNRGFNVITERLFISQLSVDGIYPLSTTRRFEVGLGGIRYGSGTSVRGPDEQAIEELIGGGRFGTQVFAEASLAYVVDHTDFGLTSPVRGARYRLQVAPRVGTERFVNVLVDARRYVHARPVTLAFQAAHAGNYGASLDGLFGDEYLGFAYSPTFIRGYAFNSFDPDDCTTAGCAGDFDRLIGTRVAKLSAEVRLPVLGVRPLSLFNTSAVPLELAAFTDAGVAWTADDFIDFDLPSRATGRSTPVVSSGLALRLNLFGALVLEPYWAYAFQRPNDPGQWGLRFQAGW